MKFSSATHSDSILSETFLDQRTATSPGHEIFFSDAGLHTLLSFSRKPFVDQRTDGKKSWPWPLFQRHRASKSPVFKQANPL